MAAPVFQVSLQASDHPLWSGNATYVIVPDREGAQAFLGNHEPVLLLLKEGNVQITKEDGTQIFFHIDDGFASFDSNHLVIAVDHGEETTAQNSEDSSSQKN